MGGFRSFVDALSICLLYHVAQVVGSNSFFFQPGAAITKYQTTMTVPAYSSGSTGAHAIWPGIENQGGGFVFQSVISDSKSQGSWEFWVEYCCNPNYEYSAIKVYPGDQITSTFSQNGNNVWTDSWSLTPGSTGSQNGQTAQSGSSSNSFSSAGTINTAVLAIEVQGGATWDFGQTQWSSITVVAATSKAWCSTGYSSSGGFQYSIAGGTSQTSGNNTTCTYGQVRFG